MELDPADVPQESAVSEPRQKPFDESDRPQKKRQRIHSGSNKHITNTEERSSSNATSPQDAAAESEMELNIEPRTPLHDTPHSAATPVSSKVTLNLRPNRTPSAASDTAAIAAPVIQSLQAIAQQDGAAGVPSGTESMCSSSTASSSATLNSPKVELVIDEDDIELDYPDSPPVAIIDDGEELLAESDVVMDFPFGKDATPADAVLMVAKLMEHDSLETYECFTGLNRWIKSFLNHTEHSTKAVLDSYARHTEFWERFPEIIRALSRRRNYFGQWLLKMESGRYEVMEVFRLYAELTSRLCRPVCQSSSEYGAAHAGAKLPNTLKGYFEELQNLLEPPNSSIGWNLQRHYSFTWTVESNQILKRFIRAGGAGGNVGVLAQLAKNYLSTVATEPKAIEDVVDLSNIVRRVVSEILEPVLEPVREIGNVTIPDAFGPVLQQAHQFYKNVAPAVENIIDKNVSALSADTANTLLANLSILFNMILICDVPATAHLIQSNSKLYPDVSRSELGRVVGFLWKFKMLKKLIVCGQMQLRVLGVSTMCADLLAIYTEYKSSTESPSTIPILAVFADFVIENKLIGYIVGIGSHPELIIHSSNIVGFLIATRSYTKETTDTIWHTVATSQDLRVVDAIARMLLGIANLLGYDSLLYFCEKMLTLPLIAFTGTMKSFCENVLKCIKTKALHDGIILPATPYELCLKIVQLSSIRTSEAPMGSVDTYLWGAERLRELAYGDRQTQLWQTLYKTLLADISAYSPTSLGSIAALNVLTGITNGAHLDALAADYNLTEIMVEYVERSNQDTDRRITEAGTVDPMMDQRNQVLTSIIQYQPDSLGPALGKRLWDAMVGPGTSTIKDRDIGWCILNTVVARNGESNSYIKTCRHELLPKLSPAYFQLGALNFLRSSLISWLQDVPDDVLESNDTQKLGLVDLLWRIIFESQTGSVEHEAASLLIELYVESPLVRSIPKVRARAVHLRLIKRCLEQLSSAAKKIKSDTSLTRNLATGSGDDHEAGADKLAFVRCIFLMREFLEKYRARPFFYIEDATQPEGTTECAGEPVSIRYQIIEGETHGQQLSLDFGSKNTLADLFALVRRTVGFDHFKLYHNGSLLVPDLLGGWNCRIENTRISQGLLIVCKQSQELIEDKPTVPPTLEEEIMNHAEELWSYLEMEDDLAQEISQFLDKLPIYPKLLDAFNDDTVPWNEIFPLGKAFKCCYAANAIQRYYRETAMDNSEHHEHLPLRLLSLTVDGLVHKEILESLPAGQRRETFAFLLLVSLHDTLSQPQMAATTNEVVRPELVRRLLELASEAHKDFSAAHSAEMVSTIFQATLDVSTRSRSLWESFAKSTTTPGIVKYLLLDCHYEVRKKTIEQIFNVVQRYPSNASVSGAERTEAFWQIISSVVDEAIYSPDQCGEFFRVASDLFALYSDKQLSVADLDAHLMDWGSLLVKQAPNTSIIQDPKGLVKDGLARLVIICLKTYRVRRSPIPRNGFAIELLRRHLFPPLSADSDADYIKEQIPLFDPDTRRCLADAIILLTKEDGRQYEKVIKYVASLPPYSAPGCPRALDVTYSYDNSKTLRTTNAGYVGMRNLSNTCYLNSLLTQLFMNVSFRDFMINMPLDGDEGSQMLLCEAQKLFAYMQNSFRRFADPGDFANQVITYEDTNIDVSIQMDVDEFYNLLFDRLESQMTSSVDRKMFRSFYGGQIVQQMKSKECPHISERLEPFSAIQCEIKGKSSLEESLQAYVDGEVMEGDNKYKCSTCDKHVDAVKRACLRDIPDNIIFHLKRFDFNLRTMMRSKINDYFAFPHRIDMQPYTVEFLTNPESSLPSDEFELVGVLVHSGTAESGHYYSYIRERPSVSEAQKWFEFNDDTVSEFDPASIETTCFGGNDYRTPMSGYSSERSWNAYMLFYQRSSVVQAQRQEMMMSKSLTVPRVAVPLPVSNDIARENEILLRKVFLNDPTHIRFVAKLSQADDHYAYNDESCREHRSGNTGKYDATMHALLAHLDQVVSRAKDNDDHMKIFMKVLKQRLEACAYCAKAFVEWLSEHSDAMRHFYLRNPEALLRRDMADITVYAMKMLRKYDAEATSGDDGLLHDVLPRFVDSLEYVHEAFHFSIRAWPQYFGLLEKISRLGFYESVLLIEEGWLLRMLQIVTAHESLEPSPQILRMLHNVNKKVTKPADMGCITALLAQLLRYCELSAEKVYAQPHRSRLSAMRGQRAVPLNIAELKLLTVHWTSNNVNIFVELLLNIRIQDMKWVGDILRRMLDQLGDEHEVRIVTAIKVAHKENLDPQFENVLRTIGYAGWVYCEKAKNSGELIDFVRWTAAMTKHYRSRTVETIMEYLEKYPIYLRRNVYMGDNIEVNEAILEVIPGWGPLMLMHVEPAARDRAIPYLRKLLMDNELEEHIDDEDKDRWNDKIKETCYMLGYSCLQHLWRVIVQPAYRPPRSQYSDALKFIEDLKDHYESITGGDIDNQFMNAYNNVMPYMENGIAGDQDEELSDEWEENGSEENDEFSSIVDPDPVLQLVGNSSDQLEDGDAEPDDIEVEVDDDHLP